MLILGLIFIRVNQKAYIKAKKTQQDRIPEKENVLHWIDISESSKETMNTHQIKLEKSQKAQGDIILETHPKENWK